MSDTPPTRQKFAAVDRSLPGKVTGRLRKAVDLMVWQAQRRADAAKLAGMTDESLRSALRKSHVMTYFNRELEVLRAGERPRNIYRLAQIRDAADNMPAVNAVKALEQIDINEAARPNANVATPGICIVIRTPDAAPIVDVTPFVPPQPPAKLEPPAIDCDPIFKV